MITSHQVQARTGSQYTRSFGDDVLYGLCQRNPRHEETRAVVAKIWLIGRSYAAAIERQGRLAGRTLTSFYRDLANHLVASDLDHHMDRLRQLDALDWDSAEMVLDVHATFLDTLSKFTTTTPRSFASKYLH
jgi:hypothetical protein